MRVFNKEINDLRLIQKARQYADNLLFALAGCTDVRLTDGLLSGQVLWRNVLNTAWENHLLTPQDIGAIPFNNRYDHADTTYVIGGTPSEPHDFDEHHVHIFETFDPGSIVSINGTRLGTGRITYIFNGNASEPLLVQAVDDDLNVTMINGYTSISMAPFDFIGFIGTTNGVAVVTSSNPNLVSQLVAITDNVVPSGFINHNTSTITLEENVGAVNDTFAVTITGTDFPVAIAGRRYYKNTETVTQVGATSQRYFIYYDATTLALTISDTSWPMESEDYDGRAFVTTVLWDAVNHQGLLGEERHHTWRDIHWHHNHHHTVGALISTAHYADAFTLSNPGANQYATFSVSQGSLYDEDVRNDTNGAVTTCNLFYHSGSVMVWDKDATTPYKLVSGVPQYDNGTGIAGKTNSNTQGYFVSWVYATNVSNDGTLDKRDIAVIVGQDNDGNMTLTEAQNAAFPTLPTHFILEWKLLYKMIFQYSSGSAITHISNTDYRTAGAMPNGQAPSSNPSAGSVSFAPSGNIAAINVQSALEELDTEKAAVAQEAWAAPSYSNSWVDYGGAFDTGGYFKDNFGVVHLKGLIKSGTVGATAFTLPTGYRPSTTKIFATSSNNVFGQVWIYSTGVVEPRSPSSNTWVSLEGISFRV